MHASAFQTLFTENKNLETAVRQRDEHIAKLIEVLQTRDRTIVGLQMTIAAVTFSVPLLEAAPPAKRRWLARIGKGDHGLAPSATDRPRSIRVMKALIEEMHAAPLRFEPKQERDESTGDVTFTTRRRSDAEIQELEAKVAAEQKALEEKAKAAMEAETSPIVAPNGQPAREGAGKILTLH